MVLLLSVKMPEDEAVDINFNPNMVLLLWDSTLTGYVKADEFQSQYGLIIILRGV